VEKVSTPPPQEDINKIQSARSPVELSKTKKIKKTIVYQEFSTTKKSRDQFDSLDRESSIKPNLVEDGDINKTVTP
jgi:hypothetical protein